MHQNLSRKQIKRRSSYNINKLTRIRQSDLIWICIFNVWIFISFTYLNFQPICVSVSFQCVIVCIAPDCKIELMKMVEDSFSLYYPLYSSLHSIVWLSVHQCVCVTRHINLSLSLVLSFFFYLDVYGWRYILDTMTYTKQKSRIKIHITIIIAQ